MHITASKTEGMCGQTPRRLHITVSKVKGMCEQTPRCLAVIIFGGGAFPRDGFSINRGGKNLGWKRISVRENQKYRYYGSY